MKPATSITHIATFAIFSILTTAASAESFLIDLTHPMGTFAPSAEDPLEPDLSQPLGDSIPYPTFGKQTIYDGANYFPIDRGEFYGGKIVLHDHHGTHLDGPAHFIPSDDAREAGNPEQKYLHELSAEELIGPSVVIDIGARVAAELDKNSGKPSQDTSVTNFSDASNNVITAADIDAIAEQIDNGVWIVANTGWSEFYFDPDFATTPYINNWNFPGFNNASIDRLIEIEEEKGVRINGIVIDNIGVDTGEASRGAGEAWDGSWHSHVRGLQRNWKFVENATNLGEVAMADSCTIVVGAPKNVMGGGGPSRIFAMCEK